MNTDTNGDSVGEDNDPGIEHLLREMGPRGEPTPEIAQAIRGAVHAEWQVAVRQRKRRRAMVGGGAVAAAASVVLGIMLFARYPVVSSAPSAVVASIAKVQGDSQLSFAQISQDSGATWHDVGAGEKLVKGALLRTGASVRVALDFGNELSVRLDGGSLLELVAADRAMLERGRVYIDVLPLKHVPFKVLTRFGTLEHLGTQYQAQIVDEKLSVSVREGRVAIAGENDTVQITSNERVVLTLHGEVTRQAIVANDANWTKSWEWAAQAAVPFDIENRSLASFLEWVARETGKTVRYDSPEVRLQAERLTLRGSVGSLTPEQALVAVLATTRFTHAIHPTSIEISL